MFAFVALIPYIWNILDLMKPSSVMDKLAEELPKKVYLHLLKKKRRKMRL